MIPTLRSLPSVLAALLLFPALAPAQTTVFVNPAEIVNVAKEPGTQISVTVKVTNHKNCRGVDLALSWDPAVLEYSMTAFGDFWDVSAPIYVGNTSDQAGHYWVASCLMGPVFAPPGTYTFIKVWFDVIGYGSTDITLSNSSPAGYGTPFPMLVDDLNAKYLVDECLDGRFSNVEVPPPPPPSPDPTPGVEASAPASEGSSAGRCGSVGLDLLLPAAILYAVRRIRRS